MPDRIQRRRTKAGACPKAPSIGAVMIGITVIAGVVIGALAWAGEL